MDPREFLVLAETLIKELPPNPAVYRTVIGRSYYAAFNVMAAILGELHIRLDKGKDSHTEVLDLIAESKDRTLKNACDSVRRQRMVRGWADYRMENTQVETELTASQAFLFAKSTIQQVDDVRSDPQRWSQAKENLLEYAKIMGKV
jgi:uncharacterized protein (UPF0332 family)